MNPDADAARFSSQDNGSINLEKNVDTYHLYMKNKRIREKKRKKLPI